MLTLYLLHFTCLMERLASVVSGVAVLKLFLIMFSKFRHTVSDQYLILVSVQPYILALGCKRLRF